MSSPSGNDLEALVVGAGASGLVMASQLATVFSCALWKDASLQDYLGHMFV